MARTLTGELARVGYHGVFMSSKQMKFVCKVGNKISKCASMFVHDAMI